MIEICRVMVILLVVTIIETILCVKLVSIIVYCGK